MAEVGALLSNITNFFPLRRSEAPASPKTTDQAQPHATVGRWYLNPGCPSTRSQPMEIPDFQARILVGIRLLQGHGATSSWFLPQPLAVPGTFTRRQRVN